MKWRTRSLVAAACAAVTVAGLPALSGGTPVPDDPQQVIDAGPYEPDWESLAEVDESPEWFEDAKFGVYWHWGAFSTPAFGDEWYPRRMYLDGSVRDHHLEKYGDDFDYDEFIDGGRDLDGNPVQFKPRLASEGGQFDPAAWLDVVEQSGAQFAGPVAEHHDGYSMWDSEVNEWNSVDRGPELDLLQIFADEVRSRDMKLLVAMHQAFHANGFFIGAPPQSDPSLQKLYGQQSKAVKDQLWFDKQREVIEEVQPDVIWNDFGLDIPRDGNCAGGVCNIEEQKRLDFLAYYYNQAAARGQEVATTFKHFDRGFRNDSAVEDYERGGPRDIVRPYWLTDDSVSPSSWSHTDGMGYYRSRQMVHSLIDRVSKNGNMLLNVSPTAEGVLPGRQQEILLDIGDYLERNGEAVYETRAWDVYGEGPNRAGGGSFTAPLEGNSEDIRFTRSKDDTELFATVLGWPGAGQDVVIDNLGADAADVSGLEKVELLGAQAGDYIPITNYSQDEDALRVTMPQRPGAAAAYVIKLSFADRVPTPHLDGGAALFTGADATGEGVALVPGSYGDQYLEEAGVFGPDVRSVRVEPGAQLTLFSGDDESGTTEVLGAGTHAVTLSGVRSLKIEPVFDGPQILKARANGGRALDSGDSPAAQSPIIQTAVDGSSDQEWELVPAAGAEGFVNIVSDDGLAMDGFARPRGTFVDLNELTPGDQSQQFRMISRAGGTVFQNRETGRVLDSGGNVGAGARLKQWDDDNSGNLVFDVESASEVAPGRPTTVTIDGPREWREGTAADLTATVAGDSGGGAVPTGSVAVSAGGDDLGTVELVNGAATIALEGDELPAGTHQMRFEYAGDAAHRGSSRTVPVTVSPRVSQPPTDPEDQDVDLALSHSPVRVTPGRSVVQLAIRASAQDGVPGGVVGVELDGEAVGRVALDDEGQASLRLGHLPVGRYDVTASYEGGGGYAASEAEHTIVVPKATTSLEVGHRPSQVIANRTKVRLRVVGSSAAGDPAGNVTVRMSGRRARQVGFLDGKAVLPLGQLAAGRYDVTVLYRGDRQRTAVRERHVIRVPRRR